MRHSASLRPELASVCRYLAMKRVGRVVHAATPPPRSGVLADLAAIRGLR
jgi:hypothetical protein